MQPVYSYDHIHLRTRDPEGTIAFYEKMFDAKRVEFVQSNGVPRVDLDLKTLDVEPFFTLKGEEAADSRSSLRKPRKTP